MEADGSIFLCCALGDRVSGESTPTPCRMGSWKNIWFEDIERGVPLPGWEGLTPARADSTGPSGELRPLDTSASSKKCNHTGAALGQDTVYSFQRATQSA